MGHEVVMFSFSLQYPGILFPGKSQYTTEPKPKDLVIHSTINSINPISWIRTAMKIRKWKPDLIYSKFWLPFLGPSTGTVIHLAKRKSKLKACAVIDNAIPHEKRPGDVPFTRYFMKGIDRFVVMSEGVLNDMKTFGLNQPIDLIPHPIYDNYGTLQNKETSAKELGLDPRNKYLLFFGFIRKYKGLDMMLRTMADDRIRKLGVKLLVAGEFYTDSQPYFDLIEEHNLGDSVIMHTDFIPNSRVKHYFSMSDVVVLPYTSATQSGITQMAYHFEIPMIGTNVGGLPEMVENEVCGLICEPNDQSLADTILSYYDRNNWDKFRKGIRIKKRAFSWSILANNILDGINEEP